VESFKWSRRQNEVLVFFRESFILKQIYEFIDQDHRLCSLLIYIYSKILYMSNDF